MILYGDQLFGTTTVIGAGRTTTTTVNYVTKDGEPQPENAKKLLTTTGVASSLSTATNIKAGVQAANYEQATAYIESLSDDQLAELEMKLEGLDDTQINNEEKSIKML